MKNPTTIAEIEQIGAQQVDRGPLFERMYAIRGEDPFTFIYTSGTTGKPKGVITDPRKHGCQY